MVAAVLAAMLALQIIPDLTRPLIVMAVLRCQNTPNQYIRFFCCIPALLHLNRMHSAHPIVLLLLGQSRLPRYDQLPAMLASTAI
jgi:hypothetical protein